MRMVLVAGMMARATAAGMTLMVILITGMRTVPVAGVMPRATVAGGMLKVTAAGPTLMAVQVITTPMVAGVIPGRMAPLKP